MTGRVVWRRIAEQDLVEAAVYIAEDSPAAAARFMDAVDETVRATLKMPGAGRPREFNNPALVDMRSCFACSMVLGTSTPSSRTTS